MFCEGRCTDVFMRADNKDRTSLSPLLRGTNCPLRNTLKDKMSVGSAGTCMLEHAVSVGDNGINLDMTRVNIKFVNNYLDWKHASLLITRLCMFLPVIRTGLCSETGE